MKVLIDMNLSPAWAAFLSEEGIPATHWSDTGAIDATHREIMAHAVEYASVVFTHDLDFGTILAASQGSGPSVVQIRSDNLKPEFIGHAVVAALRSARSDLSAGALISVEPGRSRVRILPLRRS